MENYLIRDKDLKKFNLKVKPNFSKDKSSYIYCSFTYITPNYSVILLLKELLDFTKKHNLKTILVKSKSSFSSKITE
jgi:hypothetical protein